MVLKKLFKTFIPLLLMICIANSTFAEVHLSTIPYYQVSKEEIVGGVTVCSNGNVMMFSRFIRGNGSSRLIILSPEGKLLEERFLEFDMPVFLTEINGKKMIGFIQENKTILNFIDGDYEWIFQKEIPWLNTQSINNNIFLFKVYGDPPELYVQKIIENNEPVDTNDYRVMMHDFFLPQNLFSDGSAFYYLKNYIKNKGIYKLAFENGLPGWRLFRKGNFSDANGVFNDVHKLLFVTPSKIFVQNELQIHSLHDGNLIERLHYIHDALGLSAASSRKYALLVVSAKASLNRGELIVFDKESKIILRDKESWEKGYSICGYNPANDSFIVQKGLNELNLIRVIE